MKKSILKSISKKDKIQFLTKLQTGKYILGDAVTPKETLNFKRLASGLYKCKQTGKELKKSAIEALESQYMIMIEIVDDLKTPPAGYDFIPFPKGEYLNQLLKSKEYEN